MTELKLGPVLCAKGLGQLFSSGTTAHSAAAQAGNGPMRKWGGSAGAPGGISQLPWGPDLRTSKGPVNEESTAALCRAARLNNKSTERLANF